jgi:uncharacterized protein YqjF (DUF2071 family)
MSGAIRSLVANPPSVNAIPQRPKGIDVVTTLADFAIVTYAVEPARLRAVLPNSVEPETFVLDDGSSRSFVSAVPFRDLDFRFARFPWPRLRFGQINYRAYVRYRGERAVWFFGTMLGSPLVAIPHFAWKLPWHYANIDVRAHWNGARCERYELAARGRWGSASLRATGTNDDAGRLDGFADAEQTRIVLTHPLRGLFRRRDGRLGSYSVWHEQLAMTRATPAASAFSVFADLGLVAADAEPHSVLVQQTTEFTIYLPPRALLEFDE